MLFNTGVINRIGRVDDGTATTDFEPEEIKRKVTISAALAPCEWKDHKLNFIDTPGYTDFVTEVVDCAMVVLCATAGVEVETEKVWQYAADNGMARIAFINKMDRENADYFKVITEMKEKFCNNIIPLQIPIGAEENFQGLIDLISMEAFSVFGNKIKECSIPTELQAAV